MDRESWKWPQRKSQQAVGPKFEKLRVWQRHRFRHQAASPALCQRSWSFKCRGWYLLLNILLLKFFHFWFCLSTFQVEYSHTVGGSQKPHHAIWAAWWCCRHCWTNDRWRYQVWSIHLLRISDWSTMHIWMKGLKNMLRVSGYVLWCF